MSMVSFLEKMTRMKIFALKYLSLKMFQKFHYFLTIFLQQFFYRTEMWRLHISSKVLSLRNIIFKFIKFRNMVVAKCLKNQLSKFYNFFMQYLNFDSILSKILIIRNYGGCSILLEVLQCNEFHLGKHK